jgi:hypothetical protein
MKGYTFKENPSDEDIKEYHKKSQELTDNFERRNYVINGKIKISDNPCSGNCGCYYQPDKHKIKLDINKEYTIKKIHYFGGGCPAVLLSILELPETHDYLTSLPANWFKQIN